MAECINFFWQHEFRSNKWKNYSPEEINILNKAVKKNQKTITLPMQDSKKKINVNLEKMYQKNLLSGFEQRVRCILYNKNYLCWSWKDDDDHWVCYTPRISFFLEVAHAKGIQKMDVFLKVDYEIDLQAFIQTNKETGFTRSICRQDLELSSESASAFMKNVANSLEHERAIQKMCSESETNIRNIIFDLPSTSIKCSPAKGSNLPVELPCQDSIRKALQEELSNRSDLFQDTREKIPVDPDCPESSNYHVYSEGNVIYNATLNLTSLQANNNKYFILQILKKNTKKEFAVWFHWGRVGYKGQHNLIKCGSSLNEAKDVFEKKFYDKTRNEWSDRNNFEKHPSKYDLVHTDLNSEVVIERTVDESKLPNKIQDLLRLICDIESLEEAAKEMSYDSKSTPLGKITAKQILEGYAALDKIASIIQKKGKGKDLIEACNVFYTKIPHNFGRKTPPILRSIEDVSEKLKMLEALSNIELAMGVLHMPAETCENPIDKYYRSLECTLVPLECTSDEFIALKACLLNTQGPTHDNYTLEIIDAFKCIKNDQESSFMELDCKKLLWHGSRISNWIGILKKGLQIAPPEAPSTGYMFGKGIYFADVSSKSANYCFASRRKNEGLLLLSEVSLGNSLLLHQAEDIRSLPADYNSVYAVGKYQPTSFKTTSLSSSAAAPVGPIIPSNFDPDLSLMYNEYVVYNIHQVKMKYLLRIRFDFI